MVSARVPLDVDLEDKLLYGLTPTRLAYLVIGLLAAFSIWSTHWAPLPVRAACAIVVGAVAVTGPDHETNTSHPVPRDLDDMRGADIEFAAAVRRSSTAHSTTTRLVIAEKYAARIQAALTEIGISTNPVAPIANFAFGRELASRVQHVGGFSRSWYIDRLPGTEIEPGWLFMLCPPGLAASPPWHAVPLPAAWIVHYLQRPPV